MRKSLTAVAFIASAIALSPALAASGPYSMDAKGKCHDGSGKFVAAPLCVSATHTYKLDAKGVCHDESGKFAKKDMCKS
ncbi:MAG: hypothetical protein J0I19_07460 [Alphaproteobacteria bacterium]|nr:hypothetical protein [Alphaproteobacteria bacterium]